MTRTRTPVLVLAGGGSLPPRVFHEILVSAPRRAEACPTDPVRVLVCTLASQCADAGERARASFLSGLDAPEHSRVAFAFLDFLPSHAPKLTHSEREVLLATKGEPTAAAHMHALALSGHGLAELGWADVLWFTGGDQRLILGTLKNTPFEAAMLARWCAGSLLVSGTSAGLQVCSSIALTGDFHGVPSDPARGDAPGEGDDTPLRTLGSARAHSADLPGRGLVVTTAGFPFLKDVVLDQHFIRRQRHNRLFSACLDNPGSIGIGVDEGTALVVSRHADMPGLGTARVVGDSCVFFVDTRRAATSEAPSDAHSYAHSSVHPSCLVENLACGFAWEGACLPFELALHTQPEPGRTTWHAPL